MIGMALVGYGIMSVGGRGGAPAQPLRRRCLSLPRHRPAPAHPSAAGRRQWRCRGGVSRGAAFQYLGHPAVSVARLCADRHAPRLLSGGRRSRRCDRAQAPHRLASRSRLASSGKVRSHVPMSRRSSCEIARRRTFAIISHPDAGKTTLTEKLLLFGGAITHGRHGQGPQGGAPCDLRLDAPRAAARHLGDQLGDAVSVPRLTSSICSIRPGTRTSPRTPIAP